MADERVKCPKCGAEVNGSMQKKPDANNRYWLCGSAAWPGGFSESDACLIRQQAATIERMTGLLRLARDHWAPSSCQSAGDAILLSKIDAALAAAASTKL